MLPANPVNVFRVSGGDSMYGLVSWESDVSLWYIDIQDLTTGHYYADEFSYGADKTTAEWIEEGQDPSYIPRYPSGHWPGEFHRRVLVRYT